MNNTLRKTDFYGIEELSKNEIEKIINEKEQLLLELEQALIDTQQKVENMMNEKRYYIVQLFNKFYSHEDSSFLNALTDRQYKDIFNGILEHTSIEKLKMIVKERTEEDDKAYEEIRKQNRNALIGLFAMYYPNDDPEFINNLTVNQVREVATYIENKEKINEIKELVNAKRYEQH